MFAKSYLLCISKTVLLHKCERQMKRRKTMAENYLTISEFAKLRNVSIGSLRYYEELKILVPAKIDPNTKYRYYLPEQLATLDMIIMCIEMNIPLKELNNYVDANGYLNQKQILEHGKSVMQKKIAEMQAKLEITQYALDSMERNRQYSKCKGIYTREIEERFVLEVPLEPNRKPSTRNAKLPMEAFQYAQEKNMCPVFPAGIILHYEKEPMEAAFYLQVLHPDKQDERIICLPKGNYSCLQAELNLRTDIKQIIARRFGKNEKRMFIVANILQRKMHFDSRHSEIQTLSLQAC